MTKKKLSGLFINCVAAQDSIFESGKMAFECLLGSGKFLLDYVELVRDNPVIPTHYDFYLFNYHHAVMDWLDTKSIKKVLPGIKMTLVLEVSPNDPFVFCSPDDFDAYCVLDPTLKISANNAFAFPRPLEKFNEPISYEEKNIPVIGSFGFATPGKGFEHVIDAVNREFEKAIVRINIPIGTYIDYSTAEYAHKLARDFKEKAKQGIDVVVTHDYMTKPELIRWCSQNTLNCFLYDRNLPGLAATTDQAISSGRPLITSKNNTFRHIQEYIKPFPYQSLKEAIINTQPIVKKIQEDWSAEKFRERFEEVLEKYEFTNQSESGDDVVLPTLITEINEPPISLFQKLRDIVAINTRIDNYLDGHGLVRIVPTPVPPVISYSQFGEDMIIKDLFDDIPVSTPSYLDIGANNPKFISNTYSFYERGFRGVLVEPNPYLCGILKHVRPGDTVINYGIGIDKNVEEADFYLFADEADGLSTFSSTEAKYWEEIGINGKKYEVERVMRIPLINVNDVIDRYCTECPDFISIDVEGWDLQILKTFDFNKYSPAVFCVETILYRNDGSTYRNEEVVKLLERNGYISIKETYANNIFVNRNLYDFYLYQKSSRGNAQ